MNLTFKKCTAAVSALIMTLSLAACAGNGNSGASKKEEVKNETSDIDINIEDAELNDAADEEAEIVTEASEVTEANEESESTKTVYEFVDVEIFGNDFTVTSNGGMNGSTVLAADKDLNGFLDYVETEVLQSDYKLNRQLFFDILAGMIVDKSLISGNADIEKNMIMALAWAYQYRDEDIKINSFTMDATSATDYRYDITFSGVNDTWIVNYGTRSMLINDGQTPLTTDMFKDENLTVWLIAIDEYYGF